MLKIVVEELSDLEVFVFEKVVHVHRVIEDGVEEEEREEEKDKDFEEFLEEVALPDFHSMPLSTFLRARRERKRITG